MSRLTLGLAIRVRAVITGATGNVATSVLQALADEPEVQEVIGLARRRLPGRGQDIRQVDEALIGRSLGTRSAGE